MTAAASATEIPLAIFRRAKRAGCPAFDQANRVHLAPFLRWWFAQDDDGSATDWTQRLKRSQALAAEFRTAQQRDELVDAAQLGAELTRWGHELRQLCFNEIEASPQRFAAAGQDVAAHREILRAVLWSFVERAGKLMVPRLDRIRAATEAAAAAVSNPINHEKNETTDAGQAPAIRQGKSRPKAGAAAVVAGPSLARGIPAAAPHKAKAAGSSKRPISPVPAS